jgi:hypothetical protein
MSFCQVFIMIALACVRAEAFFQWTKRIRLITAIVHAAEAWMFSNMYACSECFASTPQSPAAKATALSLLLQTAVSPIGF